MTPTIALDHDSTLAATADVAFDLIHGSGHGYSYADIESWSWGLDQFGATCYLSALWHAWTLRPEQVPVMEAGLGQTVELLRHYADVDIVTAHPDHMGISKGKMQWLADHGIEYRDFRVVPTDKTKAALDYDFFIDDKPTLPVNVNEARPDAVVYLRDQPYNHDADGEYVRVASVAEALEDIAERVDD